MKFSRYGAAQEGGSQRIGFKCVVVVSQLTAAEGISFAPPPGAGAIR